MSETPFKRMAPLVEALSQALLPYLDKPFAFFGHSMGALISFDLAKLLRKTNGLEAVHLFVSGRSAPQIPPQHPRTFDLPEPEFIEELFRLKGTPKEVLEHPELLQLILPLLRADFELTQTYEFVPDAPLDCPINAFGGLQDTDVTKDALEAWREQTTGEFSLHMLPGDHFFLQTSESDVLRILIRDSHKVVGRLSKK